MSCTYVYNHAYEYAYVWFKNKVELNTVKNKKQDYLFYHTWAPLRPGTKFLTLTFIDTLPSYSSLLLRIFARSICSGSVEAMAGWLLAPPVRGDKEEGEVRGWCEKGEGMVEESEERRESEQ